MSALAALDDRKDAILKAVVTGFVRTGEPVGSKRVAEELALGVSAATIRADMLALEQDGYLIQPHTSAGRVPTDKGYRYYVDSLGIGRSHDDVPLTPQQRAALQGLLDGASDLEDLLRRTSSVLSQLTRFAAMVVAPRIDRTRIRHVELVGLGASNVLAVLIADTGHVEKRMLVLDHPVAEHDVQRARHAVNGAAAGLRVDQAPDVVSGVAAGAPAELRSLLEAVADALRHGMASDSPAAEQMFVGGSANIAGPGYFERIEQVRQVYETFEEQVILLQTLRDTLATGDPAVRIGTELPLVELAACSVVAASYGAGDVVGSLGVLGPTRMDYPRTVAAVQAVASSLERALGELTGPR